MVASQVCEHRRFGAHSSELAVIDRVRRQLHDDILRALRRIPREQLVQLRRIGGGERRLAPRTAVFVVHRPYQSGAHPAPLQDLADEIGGRRLAVRTDDGDDLQATRRIAVQVARRDRERISDVLGDRARRSAADVGGCKHRSRAPPLCLGAFLRRAPLVQTDEQVSPLHLVRLERYAGDLDIDARRLRARALQNFAQQHNSSCPVILDPRGVERRVKAIFDRLRAYLRIFAPPHCRLARDRARNFAKSGDFQPSSKCTTAPSYRLVPSTGNCEITLSPSPENSY